MNTMRAVQLFRPHDLRLVDVPVPEPPPGEVLIRTVATTICTSDLDDINTGVFSERYPRTPGHEGAGIIERVGRGVTSLVPGDRVAAHPVVSCGACDSCRRGYRHLCENMSHLGIDRDGTFAEYFCIPADRCRVIPDQVAFEIGALMEPVTVCIQALQRGKLAEGETLLIIGDGPFGILMTRLAHLRKPGRVFLSGRHRFRMAFARGATLIDESSLAAALAGDDELPDGFPVDVAIQAVGSASAIDQGIRSVRRRGRLVIFSHVVEDAPIKLSAIHMRELELYGSCNDEDYLDVAMDALADPAGRFDELVTHRFPFTEWQCALDTAAHGRDSALKVAITFPFALER